MSNSIQMEIRRVYLKDVSFESPQEAGALTAKWKPHLDINLNTSYRRLKEEDLYEVVLCITITAKQEENVAFLVEVHQAGAFKLTDVEDPQVQMVAQTHCANVLFPFAREAITDLVGKGGFPQLLLGPLDFQSLYRQKVEALEEQKAGTVKH